MRISIIIDSLHYGNIKSDIITLFHNISEVYRRTVWIKLTEMHLLHFYYIFFRFSHHCFNLFQEQKQFFSILFIDEAKKKMMQINSSFNKASDKKNETNDKSRLKISVNFKVKTLVNRSNFESLHNY